MIVLALLFFLYLVVKIYLRESTIFPGLVFSFSLLLPIYIFKVDISYDTKLIFLLSSLIFFLFSIAGFSLRLKKNIVFPVGKKSLAILLTIGTFGFLINFLRVLREFGLYAYFLIDSKSLELSFGRYSIFNYMFFVLMLVPSLAIILKVKKVKYVLYVILPLILLPLNGIKSTFLFCLMITVFTYLQVYRINFRKLVLIVPAIFFFVYIMFSYVNRNSLVSFELFMDLIYGYIGINYENFELEYLLRHSFTYGKYTFFFLTKIFDSSFKGGYYASTDFYLISPDYNMGTVLREFFVDYGLFGMFFLLALLGGVSGFLYRCAREYGGLFYVYSSIFLTASCFAFFGNQFIRLQFIWLCIVVFGLYCLGKVRYVRN